MVERTQELGARACSDPPRELHAVLRELHVWMRRVWTDDGEVLRIVEHLRCLCSLGHLCDVRREEATALSQEGVAEVYMGEIMAAAECRDGGAEEGAFDKPYTDQVDAR